MIIKIENGRVLSRGKFERKNIYIKDSKISEVSDRELRYDKVIDACGDFVTPGFIDIHCHGGGGGDFNDGTAEAVNKAAYMHLLHGTTSLFPTITSSDLEETENALITVSRAKHKCPNLMDAHLEGPYFSPLQTGAQDGRALKLPDKAEYLKIISNHKIARWDYAPELDEDLSFTKTLVENGIIPSAGHTDATIKQMKKAAEMGCDLITHLYSCTSTIKREKGFRIAGVTEAAYLYDKIKVEIIADGRHLPDELIQLVYKYKGNGKMVLITDAMRAAGTEIKETYVGKLNEGVKCIVEDGVAKLPDRSAFAGSVATADVLVRTCINAGITLEETVKMLTEVPAEFMKIVGKGKIIKGYDADIVIFDEKINVKKVIVNGLIMK